MNNTMIPQELLEKDLTDILGMSGLDERERNEMLENLGALILEGVVLRILADMPEEEMNEFEEFLKTNPEPEALLERLKKIAPDLDTVFEEEVVAFKKECIAVTERQRMNEATEEIPAAV